MTAERRPCDPDRAWWWIASDLPIALAFAAAAGSCLSFGKRSVAIWIILAAIPASLGYLAACAVACTMWLEQRRWSRAGASAAKAVVFVLFLVPCMRAGDYVHLAILYPAYRHAIETQSGAIGTPVRFDWGDQAFSFLDGYQHETLVYDPTDGLAATVDDVRPADRGGFSIATRHLIGHFYVETAFST